jgi:protein-histidine pros-kinase
MPDRDVVIYTDRRALSQILINLVNNAIKFTEAGEVRLTVGQRLTRGRVATEISVVDTGVGMGAEDQARIFEAFVQGQAAGARPREGTGLGLHLSRKLVELLGGEIEIASALGRGSTFTLVIPGQ